MKKTISKLSYLILASAIILASCTKSQDEEVAPPTKTESDVYALEQESNSVSNMIDASLNRANATKADTFICSSDTFIVAQNALVFDFDLNPSCDNQTFGGGKITAYISGSKKAGTYRDSVVYENVKINGRTVTGKHSTKQVKTDGTNSYVFNISVRKSIQLEDGNVITWNATRKRTVFGVATPDHIDDLIRVEGDGTAKGVNGEDFSLSIITPIEYNVKACETYPRIPLIGKIEFTNNKDQSKRTVNYGIGECDNQATYTRKNGNSITFTLK